MPLAVAFAGFVKLSQLQVQLFRHKYMLDLRLSG